MVVQHNISAMNANRLFGVNNSGLAKSLEKLSSGYAINRAGDNAAGLAVSEKMRAQISGLTQASKNAEDGISMVQTFEGALQETDSILQRMRTLAVQSANGSYQDDVDREAIQLEFDQLNDELNQIADTDFNGVVVLNGGTMADGLKAVDGEFNYGNRTAADAAALKADKEALAAAKDFCGDADGAGKIVDNSKYGKTDADAIWTKLGIEVKSTDIAKPDELQITFTHDGDSWKATGVTDGSGNEVKVDSAALDKLTVSETDNGGFSIDGTSLNLIFDTNDVGKFDQATIKVQNVKADNYAPTNIGILESSVTVTATAGAKKDATVASVALNTTAVKDSTMSADLQKVLDELKNMEITETWTAGGTPSFSATAVTIAADATKGIVGGTLAVNTGTGEITYTQGANATVIATLSGTASANTAFAGTSKFKLNMDAYNYLDSSSLTATSVNTPDASKADIDMFDKTVSGGVSKSDSFDQSTGTLTYTNNITLQTGARTKDSVNFTFKYESRGLGNLKADLDCSASGLGTNQLKLSTQKDANNAIDKIDNAINKVSMVRASFGAMQNRLEHKIANLDTNNENLTAAESRIRDTDMAKEMTNFTKNQILSQASQAMLAQANQLPQGVLQLLG